METYQRGLARRGVADSDQLMRYVLTAVASAAVLIIFLIIFFIASNSVDALKDIGLFNFLFGTEWDSHAGIYGALPVITGTILVTLGAIAFALPIGLGSAIFISEVAPARFRNILKPICEIFAGIPSVVYGFFGLVVLVPFLRETFPDQLLYGSSWLAGSILLGIMALPTIISVSEDAIHSVPQSYREASLAMGASRWETTIKVIVPAAISGISSAAILGIGRAIGETMAVMMVTGNTPIFPDPIWNIFSLLTTITGTLASEMPEIVVGSTHYSALFLLALVLMAMVFIINLMARAIINRTKRRLGEMPESKGGLMDRLSEPFTRVYGTLCDSAVGRFLSAKRSVIVKSCVLTLAFVLVWMMSSLFIGDVYSLAAAAAIVVLFAGVKKVFSIVDSKVTQRVAHGGLAIIMGFVLFLLVVILGHIFVNGLSVISWDFLTGGIESQGREGGIYPAIIGTLQLIAGTVAIALPLGIISGVYLAEYSKDNTFTRIIREAIDILNGTPSIVFGLFGFAALVTAAGFGYSLIAGWITLSIMILPVIIRTTEESIRAVPRELREASLAMGATKWQTTVKVVLPAAFGGVITGSILAMGRAAGETAPIMFTAAVGFSTAGTADSIFDPVMALPFHLYHLATEVAGATDMQYGTACVLLMIVLSMFLFASVLRAYYNKKIKW
ncbi:phosphate ABC transporter permease subunit PstC [Candidatus Methanoprimaticola sp. MG2]|uniref:phosphate ABC transporter permease subunit PstC n=1 Tax=Candidatus Methanoprimaticola sp. MG2 TaxID=3228838 RepID=UPI0039C5CE57